ncbi:reverse transcriptase [Gossypium australe]|uniref:Reverse transcriptase n=1 Tax=Gossypium australe TaxID=47621 RepID=A0A5B6X0M7_9ROSI|nr:reverse transcriptase [Gossypium australe]
MKLTHFILVRVDYLLEKLVELYISKILRFYGVSLSTILDQDSRFFSKFWGKLHETLGTRLSFSIRFHPQTNGQLKRVKYLKLCCDDLDKKLTGIDLVRETKDKVRIVQDFLKDASDKQKSYPNLKRKDIEFKVENLSPRFIRPYEILERIGSIAYQLALPPELDKIHNVFHVSMLRGYRSDPSHVLTPAEIEFQPNLTYGEELVKILDREVKELRTKHEALVKVLWHHHDTKEATWEPEETMKF